MEDTDYQRTIVKLLKDSVTEAGHSDKVTDLLAAFEQFDMNVGDRTPSDIEADLQAKFQAGQDKRLEPFIDGSPKAKADLAIAIFTAKTDPENTMLLGIRSEKDMALKQMLVAELKNAARKATADATPMPALMKLSDSKRARVIAVRKITKRYAASLENASEDLQNAKLVTQEAANAKKAMQSGILDMQKEHNIQAGAFYPSQGATILLTPDPKGEPVHGTLSMLPKDIPQLTQHVFNNQKWLDQNQGVGGPLYNAIKSQFNALKPLLGGYSSPTFRSRCMRKYLKAWARGSDTREIQPPKWLGT